MGGGKIDETQHAFFEQGEQAWNPKNTKPLFYLVDGDLLYRSMQVPAQLKRNAERVHVGHIVPERTPRFLMEAMIYCIAAQLTSFSRHDAVLQSFREAPDEALFDASYLDSRLQEANVIQNKQKKKENRFQGITEYLSTYQGGIEGLADDFLENPQAVRRELVKKVNWVSSKTASLWYICLGGHELMALDRHNMRQLPGLGIDVPQKYIVKERMIKKWGRRNVPNTPPLKQYTQFEAQATAKLSDIEWLKVDDVFSPARAGCLFWYTGLLHGTDGGPFRADPNLVPIPSYSGTGRGNAGPAREAQHEMF